MRSVEDDAKPDISLRAKSTRSSNVAAPQKINLVIPIVKVEDSDDICANVPTDVDNSKLWVQNPYDEVCDENVN